MCLQNENSPDGQNLTESNPKSRRVHMTRQQNMLCAQPALTKGQRGSPSRGAWRQPEMHSPITLSGTFFDCSDSLSPTVFRAPTDLRAPRPCDNEVRSAAAQFSLTAAAHSSRTAHELLIAQDHTLFPPPSLHAFHVNLARKACWTLLPGEMDQFKAF